MGPNYYHPFALSACACSVLAGIRTRKQHHPRAGRGAGSPQGHHCQRGAPPGLGSGPRVWGEGCTKQGDDQRGDEGRKAEEAARQGKKETGDEGKRKRGEERREEARRWGGERRGERR